MSDINYNYRKCKDCDGNGIIITPFSKKVVTCIICNGSGSTSHGPRSEAEQVFLFKLAWDFIHGKEKGWYH